MNGKGNFRRATSNPLPSGLARSVGLIRPGAVAYSLAFTLLLGAVVTAPVPAVANPPPKGKITDQKKKIRQIQFEKEQVGRQLAQFRDSEKEILGGIEQHAEDVRVVRRRLEKMARRRRQQKNLQRKRHAEVGLLSARIAANRREISTHLTRLYRLSKGGESASLLSLARHGDFFKNQNYLATLIQTDQQKILRFERSAVKLAEKEKEIAELLLEVAHLEQALIRERKNLVKQEKELKDSLKKTRNNRKTYRKYLLELDKIQQGMEDALAGLEKGALPLNGAAPDPNSLRRQLPAPVEGAIIALFGKQDPRYKLKKFQRGIVIRVAAEAPVHAVAAGRVVHAGPFRGYQELVVLDHGRNLFSVYGHLEQLETSKGKIVAAGATLGKATFQPVEGAHNLYFEIRLAGKPVDPQQWLKPKALKP